MEFLALLPSLCDEGLKRVILLRSFGRRFHRMKWRFKRFFRRLSSSLLDAFLILGAAGVMVEFWHIPYTEKTPGKESRVFRLKI